MLLSNKQTQITRERKKSSYQFHLSSLERNKFKNSRKTFNKMLRQGTRKAYVIGVGMTKFEKPGRRENFDYPDMAKESVGLALNDAKIRFI